MPLTQEKEQNAINMLWKFVNSLKNEDYYNEQVTRISSVINDYAPQIVQSVWIEVLAMLEFVKDTGKDKQSKLLIVAALVYLVSPVDVIPDSIPVVGYVDDAYVIKWVADRLNKELKPYRIIVQQNIMKKKENELRHKYKYDGPRKKRCCEDCIIL
eukprot:UN07493